VCAALLADRVNRAGVVSGIGPTLSSEDSEDMMRSNQILFALARRSELAVVPLNSLVAELARRRPHQAIKAMRRQLPPSDAAILQRPEIFEAFADDAHRASSTSARASAQDMTLFARPWGFDLTEIAVPVDFWQGDADRNVPASHARLQAAKVPGSTLHEFPGEGHLLCIDRLEEILRAVSR
ncbi:MAG: alpha/beta fold hydrolase, partial [Acidimicrobiales bacterium]